MAHPGLRHTGLAAVIAPELSREAVFRALTTRSTYGTTGVRIFMRFAVAGAPMGAVTQALGRVSGSVTVAAPGEIRYAEVVALDTGSSEWRVAARWERPGRLLETDFEDTVGDSGVDLLLESGAHRTDPRSAGPGLVITRLGGSTRIDVRAVVVNPRSSMARAIFAS